MTKEELRKVPFRMVAHLSTAKMCYLTYSSEDGLLGFCDRTPKLKHGQFGKTRRHWRIGGKVYKSDEAFYEALAGWTKEGKLIKGD